MYTDTCVRQYLETALWSSTDDDEDNTPLDAHYSVEDFSPEAIARATRDCVAFMSAWRSEIDTDDERDPTDYAHDFWLTRNRHGAGFWDGDYPDELGKRLTDAAHQFGESEVYVGDDGQLYLY